MKALWHEFGLKGLTIKQKVIVWYFALSFCSLFVDDETPIWIVLLLVLNFANSARLVKKVPLPKID
jgi:hypothetical protein